MPGPMALHSGKVLPRVIPLERSGLMFGGENLPPLITSIWCPWTRYENVKCIPVRHGRETHQESDISMLALRDGPSLRQQKNSKCWWWAEIRPEGRMDPREKKIHSHTWPYSEFCPCLALQLKLPFFFKKKWEAKAFFLRLFFFFSKKHFSQLFPSPHIGILWRKSTWWLQWLWKSFSLFNPLASFDYLGHSRVKWLALASLGRLCGF